MTMTRGVAGWTVGFWACALAVPAWSAGNDGTDAANQGRWAEYRRFAPFMSAASADGRWTASPEYALELGVSEWSDPRLAWAAQRIGQIAGGRLLGEAVILHGSLDVVKAAELVDLGFGAVFAEIAGDEFARDLNIAEALLKIGEMGAYQALGRSIVARADAERWSVLERLTEVAAELGGPTAEQAPLRMEVWMTPGDNLAGLRATNIGDANLSDVTIRVGSTLGPASSPGRDVVFVESWPAGATIVLPTRLAGGMTSTHAPRLQHGVMDVSAWCEAASIDGLRLDMPGYARDERVPAPNAVSTPRRPVTSRFMLVEDAYGPRPAVIDPSGEPVAGWERVAIRPTRAMDASRAIRGVFEKFRCGECTGTGEVTKREAQYGPPINGIRPFLGYRTWTERCSVCEGRKYASGNGGDGMMDGFTRAAAGVSPEDAQYDGALSAIRDEITKVLEINPSRAVERLNPRGQEHLNNGRLRTGTPIWLVGEPAGDVTSASGETFRAIAISGVGPRPSLVALESITFDAARQRNRCIAGGIYDGHIQTSGGQAIPLLRGGFRIGG